MARLAFVTSLVPTRKPDTGFEIANAAIVAALRRQGHTVLVAGFARPSDDLADDPDRLVFGRKVIENAEASSGLKARWLARALLGGLPVAVAKLADPRPADGADVSERLKAAGPFDALVLNSVTMAGAFPAILQLAPAILVEHNIEFVSARQNAAHAGSMLMRALFAREARLMETLERRLWSDSRFIWCLAEEDRRSLPEAAQARAAVLPLIPPGDAVTIAPAPSPRFDIGLIGTWTWEPNLIGLSWFLGEVAPRLPGRCRIGVAGRMPAGFTLPPALAGQVDILGRVPDADAFLADCRVMALASRAGTGVQLKTIETLARGWPAVATPLSLRGLGQAPANVIVAEEADAFAAALAGQVEAARAGRLGPLDGAAFVAAQRHALERAVDQGIAAGVTGAAAA
jgi:hypothetical protein